MTITGTHATKRKTSDDVVDGLSHAIHEHRISPGTKLGEDEVADIFGVSRTIVRSALQQLAHQQLVTLERHRGAFVARPDPAEAREVMEARSLLEPRTARSAADRITDADIALLHDRITAEHSALASGNYGQALHLSGRFHTDVARIADQKTIAAFIETLVARSSLVIALYWRRKSAICESHAHNALITALEAGDGLQAEEIMHGHIVDLAHSLDFSRSPKSTFSLREAIEGRR
ncbi:GntR family transcriptional regulator [Algicella marina]|uniref:FCD domain-containing protein n=1 Tax=Algicella marina TaxID=2683284 RepID=A0A6P1T0T2_9RHOB|nr:GntR family transcriptional regulator [Algicella marina]QHQ35253.1 FCD domain-containing protein [Algicella marina]